MLAYLTFQLNRLARGPTVAAFLTPIRFTVILPAPVPPAMLRIPRGQAPHVSPLYNCGSSTQLVLSKVVFEERTP